MTKDPAYLQHMLDMIERIEIATAAGKNAFFDSVIHQDAVLRNLAAIFAGKCVRIPTRSGSMWMDASCHLGTRLSSR